jgi:uroporphyrin-III C-methyltransferase
MVNNNEHEKNVTITQEEEHSIQEPIDKSPTKTSLIGIIASVIAVVALLIAGYSLYTIHNAAQNLTETNKRLASDLRQMKQQQLVLVQQIKEKTKALQKTNNSLDEKINNFTNQIQMISTQKSNQNQDWLLLKVRYYLELAQINAHWSVNSKDDSTLTLLQQADIVLAQIKAPELFKVRQIIAKELLQLKEASSLDVPGLLSQLDAIQNSISQLNNQSLSFNPVIEDTKTSPSADSSWRTRIQYSLSMLKKLVVVRRNDEEIQPLLSPTYESLLKESIRLNIQEAQWAIINNNPTVYRFALNQALATIKRAFNEHLSNTTAIINQLTNLQKINLIQEKLKVGQALPLINQLIEQKQLSKSVDPATAQEEQDQ